jgi:hypothetical protein
MKKEELIEKVDKELPSKLREIIEYKNFLIVLRDPIEDHDPSYDNECADWLEQEQYDNDEVYDLDIHSLATGEVVSSSDGHFGRDNVIDIAQNEIEDLEE